MTKVQQRIHLDNNGIDAEWTNQIATIEASGEAEEWQYKLISASVIIGDKVEVEIPLDKHAKDGINKRVAQLMTDDLEESINELFWGMSREEYIAEPMGKDDGCAYSDWLQDNDKSNF